MLAYEKQLENLCDQALREEGQEKLRELMDQILQLLAENQRDAEEFSTPHFVVPSYQEITSTKYLCVQIGGNCPANHVRPSTKGISMGK